MRLRHELFWTLAALLMAILAFYLSGVALARAQASDIIGWIEIAPAGEGKIAVTGHAYALVATTGKFALALERGSQGNVARTGQSGSFKAAPGDNVKLSSTTINLGPGEHLRIELCLIVEGREIPAAVLATRGDQP